MNTMTRDELWAALQQAALVGGEVPPQGEKDSPWFVRVMLGVAGWIGALFLIGFVGVALGSVLREQFAFWIIGAFACGGAALLFRAV